MDLKALDSKVDTKASGQEVGKLWKHFSNYAEYQDLKDLYAKVVPPL